MLRILKEVARVVKTSARSSMAASRYATIAAVDRSTTCSSINTHSSSCLGWRLQACCCGPSPAACAPSAWWPSARWRWAARWPFSCLRRRLLPPHPVETLRPPSAAEPRTLLEFQSPY